MSGIARILLQRGGTVSGSDLRDGRALDELRILGARIDIGHDEAHVRGADIVVMSTAVPPTNREITAAREAGQLVLRRAEMLARLMEGQQAVLIAGTHGKTTTTSMSVVALQAAGCDPSFAIGGSLNESGTNAHAGSDRMFVAEADESDRSFLVYRPDIAVITNLEHDHPDEFSDLAAVTRVFRDFAQRRAVGAPTLLCADDAGTRSLAEEIDDPVLLYGTDARADIRTVVGDDGHHVLRQGGQDIARFTLAVPGRHNILNATAALATCVLLDIDPADAAPGLARFTGAARRYQHLGVAADVTVVDDYAHHPTELRATLAAARSATAARIVVVVQPHRYSRTEVFGEELGRAAAAADVVVVTEVYASGESPVPGVSGRTVADAATAAGANVHYEPHLADVVTTLADLVQPGDLVLTTGAGDVTQVGPALLKRLGGDA
jgi:UDP-N-acetylmuramate--alanine ligase